MGATEQVSTGVSRGFFNSPVPYVFAAAIILFVFKDKILNYLSGGLTGAGKSITDSLAGLGMSLGGLGQQFNQGLGALGSQFNQGLGNIGSGFGQIQQQTQMQFMGLSDFFSGLFSKQQMQLDSFLQQNQMNLGFTSTQLQQVSNDIIQQNMRAFADYNAKLAELAKQVAAYMPMNFAGANVPSAATTGQALSNITDNATFYNNNKNLTVIADQMPKTDWAAIWAQFNMFDMMQTQLMKMNLNIDKKIGMVDLGSQSFGTVSQGQGGQFTIRSARPLTDIISSMGLTASQAADYLARQQNNFGNFNFGTNTGSGIKPSQAEQILANYYKYRGLA